MLTDAALVELLPSLRQLARQAGDAVMRIYHSDFAVKAKEDKSPVTAADLESERIILAGLARLTPDIPVVSEEAAADGASFDVSGGTFWLVDPLDGTKEFVKRNGEFTVNIGLIINGEAKLGVVYAPAIDRLFSGAPGLCTVEDQGAAPRPARAREPGEAGWVVLSSRSHRDPARFDAFIKDFKVAETKFAGSSLKFALVGAGEADLYPRFGVTMEWDTAAGHAVLNAGGGALTEPDGTPLRYGKTGFVNPSVVAWGQRRKP